MAWHRTGTKGKGPSMMPPPSFKPSTNPADEEPLFIPLLSFPSLPSLVERPSLSPNHTQPRPPSSLSNEEERNKGGRPQAKEGRPYYQDALGAGEGRERRGDPLSYRLLSATKPCEVSTGLPGCRGCVASQSCSRCLFLVC